jgi:ferredoxin
MLEIISENRPYFEDGKIVCGELACGSCNVDLLYELLGVDRINCRRRGISHYFSPKFKR